MLKTTVQRDKNKKYNWSYQHRSGGNKNRRQKATYLWLSLPCRNYCQSTKDKQKWAKKKPKIFPVQTRGPGCTTYLCDPARTLSDYHFVAA